VDDIVSVMDQVGIVAYCDLTSNVAIQWTSTGYSLSPGDIEAFRRDCVDRHPGRFYGFTTATFNRPLEQPLFTDAHRFVEETIEMLRHDVGRGALGLKVLKELGLRYRDAQGNLVVVDDERLAPIWQEAARLGVPVLIHQSDPYGFFQPNVPENEHFETLRRFPNWAFDGPEFPGKAELLSRRDRLVRSHPDTTFMLPHVANFAEDLDYVAGLLDECPNAYVDLSARMDELGRQPYSARDFVIRYQDRITFGTDMPASVEMYRSHFRFLETFDEYFEPPYYDGSFGSARWCVQGLGLPKAVLRKVYHGNILNIIPALQDVVGGFT
jgi:predicted TIM-barrel fold metal-dependent hydrolase